MARRLCICATILFVAFGALASDRDCTRDRAPRVIVQSGEGSSVVHAPRVLRFAQDDVEAGFSPPSKADRLKPVATFSSQAPSIEIIVVRIGADGKPMYACVDSAAAAKRFLEAPLEKINVREAREK
ncbi:MAG TPA: hypothetical protein VNA69_11505 [Thermoanaerobaculia bacterium]|nr:hypothetical protein [Thermoanaerobaculia bacterium]